MKEMSVSSKETTTFQVKGEKQLSNLSDSVQLISVMFDEYKNSRKAKDELIAKTQVQVMELTDKVS